MAPKKLRREDRSDPTLAFDITQEIDPGLVDDVRHSEPTLTQLDFADIAVALPEKRKPRL